MSIRVSTAEGGPTVYTASGPAGPEAYGAAFWVDEDGLVRIETVNGCRIKFGDLVVILARLKRDQHTPAGVVEVPAGYTDEAVEEFRRKLVETVGHPIEIRRPTEYPDDKVPAEGGFLIPEMIRSQLPARRGDGLR